MTREQCMCLEGVTDGIMCRPREKWWEELNATKEEVVEVLIRKRNLRVRDIQTSNF